MTTFAQNPILARFADQPALLDPNSNALVASLLGTMAAHPRFAELAGTASADDDFWTELGEWGSDVRPYVVANGLLQIPVKGVLLNDFPYSFYGWATGYDYIWRAFERGMGDANVSGIALVIDSPGGMVAGCFDAADKALALKAEVGKPVAAFAAESAYSAAYAWACVGDTIAVSRTGGVGSIGVVTMHVDYSAALEKSGAVVTYIHAGKHKVDGNPYQALPNDVKVRIQTRIDELYTIFVDHVAACRPLDAAAVRATEALCFTASEAKSNGLADSIGALDDALAAFAADLSPPSEGEDTMSKQDNSAADPTAEQQAPAVDAAQIAADAGAAARTAERQRIAAITGSDEAKDRPALAAHLAHNTDTSVEDAKAMLAVAGKESAPEAATPFSQHMDASEQPGVGGAAAGADADDADADDASNVIALAARSGIKGFAKRA